MEINKENACCGKQEIGSQTENESHDIQIQFQGFFYGLCDCAWSSECSFLLWFFTCSFKWGNTCLPVPFLDGCSGDNMAGLRWVFKVLALVPVVSDDAWGTAALGKMPFSKEN